MFTNAFLHLEIAEFLETQINNGTYKAEEKLPSENDLCKAFNTNHHIVRQAISRLANCGLITSRQGKGSYVNARLDTIPYPLSSRTSFTENLKKIGLAPDGKLLHWINREPTAQEARQLKLMADENVYELQIIRFVDQTPASFTITLIAEKNVPGFPNYLPEFHSLYQLLDKYYHIRPNRKQSIIQAVLPQARDAELLDIPESMPIMQIESVTEFPHGWPFEYQISRIRSDLYQYVIHF